MARVHETPLRSSRGLAVSVRLPGRDVPGGRGPRRWRRLLVRLAVLLAAAGLLLAVVLWFEVGRRFEGRLWDLPSHVYSARLSVTPQMPLTTSELARRLERLGYGRTTERGALRPGQFRVSASRLDVHRRGFRSPPRPVASLPVTIRFSGSRVASIRDGRKRALERVVFEPELLATFFGPQQEEREVLRLEDVPQPLIDAVIAIEDARFHRHHGLDPRAIGRAVVANLRHGRIVQGGSTISQQTIKNLYVGSERTWWRKIREAPMAVLLDLRYSKKRILEAYLNEVYLGQRGPVAICGVAAASRFYFGRDLPDLTLGEAALLAGLIQNPGGTNPFRHPAAALARRDQVLAAMERAGTIDAAARARAAAERLHLASGSAGSGSGSYVADLVRSQLEETYSRGLLSREGLRIYTTIDTLLQERAERALGDGLERLDRAPGIRRQSRERRLQGCVIATQPRTGAVLALVGGRDYRQTQFNRAVQARRQPGSCFKPFVYLATFQAAIDGREGGLTPISLVRDEPLELRAGGRLWRPENYDRTFRGAVTVRRALEASLNLPAVHAARQVGIPWVVQVAERCGFSDLEPLPSVALGAQEVSPLELATAYGTIAQLGQRVSPRVLTDVVDRDGRRLARPVVRTVRAVSPQAAYLVTDLMRGVLRRGTAASAYAHGFSGEGAGKTGTTDDTRDSWFVGYTPEMLALVWVGFDDNARTGLTGATGALPIWADFLRRAGLPGGRTPFRAPEGIVRVEIDPETRALAGDGCPMRTVEVFARGTEPEETCSLHEEGFFRWFQDLFD